MIVQDLVLGPCDWIIRAFYDFTCSYMPEVINALYKLNYPRNKIIEIAQSLIICKPNSGLTCSNLLLESSVMVISDTTSEGEFFNTLEHENQHLLGHIAIKYGLVHGGEPLGYLAGELALKQHKFIKNFI